MYRFLLTARWLGFAVFVLVVAGTAIRLGAWQFDRWDERGERNDHVRELVKKEHVAPAEADEDWTRVEAHGRYLPDNELAVKFAVRDSQPGATIVTPLLMADGTAVLVDRGWLPTENTGKRPTDIPPPPEGDVEVIGYWHPDSEAGTEATWPADGQIRAISSDALGDVMDLDLVPGYVSLTEQEPAAPEELATADDPEFGSGPHFFYALQWWFFAGLAIVGYFWFARAEAKQSRKIFEGVQARATRSA